MPVINSYLPRMSSRKLPESPGKIIAEVAIIPHRKRNHSASGVVTGMRSTTIQAAMAPAMSEKALEGLSGSACCLKMTMMEAAINPKKADQVSTAW